MLEVENPYNLSRSSSGLGAKSYCINPWERVGVALWIVGCFNSHKSDWHRIKCIGSWGMHSFPWGWMGALHKWNILQYGWHCQQSPWRTGASEKGIFNSAQKFLHFPQNFVQNSWFSHCIPPLRVSIPKNGASNFCWQVHPKMAESPLLFGTN